MQTDLSHYIPRRLDDPMKFLFWEMDVAAIVLFGLIIGILVDSPILGTLFGIGMAHGYSKIKQGQHPGVAAHTFYWVAGLPRLKELPASHLREFNG